MRWHPEKQTLICQASVCDLASKSSNIPSLPFEQRDHTSCIIHSEGTEGWQHDCKEMKERMERRH